MGQFNLAWDWKVYSWKVSTGTVSPKTLKALRRKGIMSSLYNDTKKLFQGRNGPIAIDKGTPAV
jgi:hypothetical protein